MVYGCHYTFQDCDIRKNCLVNHYFLGGLLSCNVYGNQVHSSGQFGIQDGFVTCGLLRHQRLSQDTVKGYEACFVCTIDLHRDFPIRVPVNGYRQNGRLIQACRDLIGNDHTEAVCCIGGVGGEGIGVTLCQVCHRILELVLDASSLVQVADFSSLDGEGIAFPRPETQRKFLVGQAVQMVDDQFLSPSQCVDLRNGGVIIGHL